MEVASSLLRGLVSLGVLALLSAGCSATAPDATESPTESTEVAESLPDATSLAALEDGSFSPLDTVSSASVVTQATSDIPDFCTDGRLPEAFRAGENLGARWVKWLWHRFRCCDKVEKFAEALVTLVDEINQRATTKQGVSRCRHTGIEQAAIEELDRIQTQCEDDCYARGDAFGASEAEAYCDLAIATAGQLQPSEWTRQAVGLCGFAYQLGCDAKFLGVTTSYVTARGACEAYTRDPFANIWDLSRLKSCDYYQRSSRKRGEQPAHP